MEKRLGERNATPAGDRSPTNDLRVRSSNLSPWNNYVALSRLGRPLGCLGGRCVRSRLAACSGSCASTTGRPTTSAAGFWKLGNRGSTIRPTASAVCQTGMVVAAVWSLLLYSGSRVRDSLW